ncbi:hypothetical protein D9601_06520 [Sphingomonas sp. MA1305]|uniref:hypothetical protein n=1 Tax=Sphingomonas sp. MA1305 TaxID=2479204 RepID=UPI0018DFC3F7|nr:hypothetical protein [Sphingomonas sp. MA1305]MBI0475014.1 hypothetical protein [Sphingomonas sp. MA1305]
MDNTSLAAQAVAKGPPTLAPPSFDGHGWLVVVNLAGMTFTCIVAAMFAYDALAAMLRNNGRDLPNHPVTIWRRAGFCFAAGIAVRTFFAAVALWNWNPRDPIGTGWFLTLQRFADPIALAFGLAGLGMFYLSAPGMVAHLRRKPFPIAMWASLPMLRRPAAIALLSLIAAVGVVSTR